MGLSPKKQHCSSVETDGLVVSLEALAGFQKESETSCAQLNGRAPTAGHLSRFLFARAASLPERVNQPPHLAVSRFPHFVVSCPARQSDSAIQLFS
jgi:hypothetical protein